MITLFSMDGDKVESIGFNTSVSGKTSLAVIFTGGRGGRMYRNVPVSVCRDIVYADDPYRALCLYLRREGSADSWALRRGVVKALLENHTTIHFFEPGYLDLVFDMTGPLSPKKTSSGASCLGVSSRIH